MNKKGGAGKIILIILVIVVLAATIYFTFFFAYTCNDIACFRAHQEKCARTKFINDQPDVKWQYLIKGKQSGSCDIEIKILETKTGSLENLKLEGESMDCYLTIGNLNAPEGDISLCHGELKEELQNIIIQQLHSYIVTNVGEIGIGLNANANAGNIIIGTNSTNVKTNSTNSTK